MRRPIVKLLYGISILLFPGGIAALAVRWHASNVLNALQARIADNRKQVVGPAILSGSALADAHRVAAST